MKLSKKGLARQRTIARAIASGKTLGGLLAGLAAATFAGCRDNTPSTTMGDFPRPQQEQKPNSNNEKQGRNPAVRGRYLIEPEKPNEKNENTEVFVIEGEMPLEPEPNAKNEKESEFEFGGDVDISGE